MRACLSAASAVSRADSAAASAPRSVDLAARRFHSKDTRETARAKIATTSSPDTHVFLPRSDDIRQLSHSIVPGNCRRRDAIRYPASLDTTHMEKYCEPPP
jgi:hypothetical protein